MKKRLFILLCVALVFTYIYMTKGRGRYIPFAAQPRAEQIYGYCAKLLNDDGRKVVRYRNNDFLLKKLRRIRERQLITLDPPFNPSINTRESVSYGTFTRESLSNERDQFIITEIYKELERIRGY